MYAEGQLVKVKDDQGFYVYVPFSPTHLLAKRQIKRFEVRIDDGRSISGLQRRKIYATLRDVAAWTGHHVEELKDHFKAEYVARTGNPWFSTSSCSMTTANEYLEILLEHCLEWEIPTQDNLAEYAPDISRYLYMCLYHKKCCITRKSGAHLHHVDHVGSGRDRREIIHKGMRAMPLLPEYHDEAHLIGQESFNRKYKVFGIKLDDDLCKVWGLKNK